MAVSYKEYDSDKMSFFKKHDHDFRVDTSMMDEYGRYHKEYCFADGAIWYEVMSPTYTKVEQTISVNGIEIQVEVEVKMLSTEYFSTDNAHSKYYYERFNHTQKKVVVRV